MSEFLAILNKARIRRTKLLTISNCLDTSGVRELPPDFTVQDLSFLPMESLFWWHDLKKDTIFIMVMSLKPNLNPSLQATLHNIYFRISSDLKSFNINLLPFQTFTNQLNPAYLVTLDFPLTP